METPLKVSVCMASWNGEAFIKLMIDSILQQLSADDELIISDDCSTDSTCSIIKRIEDPRIRLIRQKKRVGVVKNFETALSESTGTLLFLADQDDLWLPGKVERCRTALQKTRMVVHNAEWIDENGASLGVNAFQKLQTKRGLLLNLYKNRMMGCCMAMHRELWELSRPWPDQLPMHDWWLALLAEKMRSVTLIPEPLMQWRVHSRNSSDTYRGSQQNFSKKMGDRWQLIKLLLRRV